MKIYTIGFTKTTAENFFDRLKHAKVKTIIDVRLNNTSQLSGFAKRDDLKYFAKILCGTRYRHFSDELAPTKEIRDAFNSQKKSDLAWDEYEKNFLDLLSQRKVETMDKSIFDGGCLLCSEDTPHKCHRRLIAEYLKKMWGNIEIVHL